MGKIDKLDHDLLLAYVLNVDRALLHAHDFTLTQQQEEKLKTFIARREAGEPLAYLTGKKEFWSMELMVTNDTLVPRPETEILVETALHLLPAGKAEVADLGTGSGAIAVALASERPEWHIYATDISKSALQIASKNAQQFKLENISFHLGNWCTALPCEKVNMIVANPPYISEMEWPTYADGLQFEPRSALVAKDDGLSAIKEIAQAAMHYLIPGGYLLIEHGFNQGAAVANILAANEYINIYSVKDFSGNQRVSYGQCRI